MTRTSKIVTAAVLFAVCLVYGTAGAQMTAKPVPRLTPDVNAALIRAQELENQGRNDEAKSVYELLYETVKTDNVFWKLLLIYEKTGDHDGMERLVRQRLDMFPGDPSMKRYLARVYYTRGNNTEGKRVLLSIIEGRWNDVGIAYLVANEFSYQKDYDSAVEVYERVRKEVGNDKLFAPTLAAIYGARMDYTRAIVEYLKQLQDSKPAYQAIEDLIRSARENGMTYRDIERPIGEYLSKEPANLNVARLLSDYRYANGDFDGAYKALLPAAVASNSPVDVAMLAERFRRDGRLEQALRAYEDYYRHFEDDPSRVSALIAAGAVREDLGDTAGALELYERLEADYRGTSEGDRAALRRLALSGMLDKPEDRDRKLADFAAATPHREVAREAWMMLARSRLSGGNIPDAKAAFEQAALKSRTNDEKYETAVESAWLHFFAGDSETMTREIDAAMQVNPAGDDANDLLRLKVLDISGKDGAGDTGAGKLAEGLYALYRNDTESALATLSEAASDTSSAASYDAAVAIARYYAGIGDTASASGWYIAASDGTADRSLSVGAKIAAADLFAETTGGQERAVELYREALSSDPDNIYASRIRRTLMSLVDR